MNRRAWAVFVLVQAVGLAFSLAANHTMVPSPLVSGIGVALLICGDVLLLPGDLAGMFLIQRFLFHTSLTIGQMSLLGILSAVAVNSAVWLLCARLYRFLRERRKMQRGAQTP